MNGSFIERLLEEKSKLALPEEVIKGFEAIQKFDKILNEKSRLYNSIDDKLHRLDAQSAVHAAERYQLHQRQLFLTQPDEELLERLFPTKGLGDDSDDDDDDDDNIKLEGDDPDAHSEFDDDRHSSMSRRTNTDSRAQRQRPELIEMAPRARRRNRVKLPEIGGERPESSISITSIDIAAKSPEHFQQNFIQRNRELLSEGKYFYSMTEAERRRLETILANRRIVPSKEILQRASTSTSDQSFKSDAKDQQAEEETEEDLMFINEFLPDEEHARELDDINQRLKKLSGRLFQLSQHAAEWEERMKSAAVRREQHLHATTTIADSQTVGMRSVATAATTVDDVMTRNFHVVLHEFEEETRRLRQIDDRLQQLRAAPETDLPVPSKAQLEALLASGFREEDEQLFCDEGWTDLNSEAEDADDNKSDSLNDGS